jgi:hypothetical protein
MAIDSPQLAEVLVTQHSRIRKEREAPASAKRKQQYETEPKEWYSHDILIFLEVGPFLTSLTSFAGIRLGLLL